MYKIIIGLLIDTSKYTCYMFLLQLLGLQVLFASSSNGQSLKNTRLSIHLEDVCLTTIFQEIEKKTEFVFAYSESIEGDTQKYDVNFENARLHHVLQYLSNTAKVDFRKVNSTISVSSSILKTFRAFSNRPGVKTVKRPEKAISGRVTDTNNEGLPGVTIRVANTPRTGTITDIDGYFKLVVDDSVSMLVFSIVGFETQRIDLNNNTSINVVMKESTSRLDEVVVIGYGSVIKKDLTGSVSTIKSKSIEELTPVTNVEQVLQGQAAGVQVVQETGQPGSAARVRVRGSTSLLGSNQPLYVIDGIPVVAESNIPNDGSAFNNALLQQGLNTPLGNINPNDIASISVLKDASAAAIYGSRAANGVIIITTKSGTELSSPQFTAGYSLTTQSAITTEVLNAQQFREIWTEAVENSSSTNSFAQSVLDGSYFGDADTNWENEISRSNPITSNFDFSVRGGTEAVKYYTSLGVQNQEGTFDNSSFNRYTFSLNLDTKFSDKFLFGTKTNISNSKQVAPDGGLLDRIYDFRPDVEVFDENGELAFSEQHNLESPLALSQATNTTETTLLLASIYAELELAEGLRVKSVMSINHNSGGSSSFYPSTTLTGGWSRLRGSGGGYAQESSSNLTSHIWENTLTYTRAFESHAVTSVAGASWQGDKNEFLKASGEGFPDDEVLTNLTSASESFEIASNEVRSGLASYFGRVNYSYSDKYLLTIAARVDGSSKFATDNQWAFFPTLAMAWRISQEPFIQNISFINDLKIRSSIGTTGQQSFGPYQWRTLFAASDYAGNPGVLQSQLGNDELRWETSQQFDVGLDFTLWDGRIIGTAGYYQKNTEDLLYFVNVPGSTGSSSVIANIGDTENTGIELELSGDIVQTDDFLWNLSVNISKNRNKLTKLNEDYLDEDFGLIDPPNTGSYLRVGDPIGLIFGRVALGIFQTQEEIDELNSNAPDGIYQSAGTAPGDLIYMDISGPDGVPDGEITSLDQTIIGNTQADWFGGITSRWSYKGISVSTLFTYSIGNDLRWDAQRNGVNFASTFISENKIVDVLNRWTPENPTNQPRAVYLDPNNNDAVSSYYIHDASFIRLRNINVSYALPISWIEKTGFMKSASISFAASNLFIITSYPGADPETNNLFDNDVSSGLDNNRYPTPRVFTGGVKIGF